MNNSSRRTFVLSVIAGTAAVGTVSKVAAQAAGAPKLPETDPQAVALGYKDDTTKVDQAKFPKHTPAQMCNGCSFYQGKVTDPMAPCTLFAGKQVMGKGWCSAWAKKAA